MEGCAASRAASPGPVPGFAREAGPVRPDIVPIHLEEPVVAALARRAREAGASVHGLIGAAELVAARSVFDAGAGRRPRSC